MSSDYCFNTFHSYQLEGDDGMLKMQDVMKMFRYGFKNLGGVEVARVVNCSAGSDGGSGAVEYRLAGGASVEIKPSRFRPKVEVYFMITSDSKDEAAEIEKCVIEDIESIIYIDYRAGYCCE